MRATGWRGTLPWLGAAAACAAGAALLVASAAAGTDRRAVALGRVASFAPHHDLWVRLLRGGLGRITIPFLLLVAAGALVWLARRRRWREAVVAAGVLVGANGLVEAVKHGLVGIGAPVLSGHMALVVATGFAVVLATTTRWRRRAAVVAAAAVLATGVGGVGAAWHTAAETAGPTLVAVAWVLACRPLLDAPRRSVPREDARPAGVGARS